MVMDPEAWTAKHLLGPKGKVQRYLEARKHMPGYEAAPIGFDFTNPNVTPEFKTAVETALDVLRANHPDVTIVARWRS